MAKKKSFREKFAEVKRKLYALRNNPQAYKEGAEAFASLKATIKEFKDLIKIIKNA